MSDLRVLMVSAFWRDDEPGGIAAGMQFPDEDGETFCQQLEDFLPEYDKLTLEEVQSELRRLSPRRLQLSRAEISHVIACVHWMQRRRHLTPDEYNGTMFAGVMDDGTIVSSEKNPITIDIATEMKSDNAVDVTDIFKASKLPDAGLKSSLRAVVDHARDLAAHCKRRDQGVQRVHPSFRERGSK
jgi:hypothetical protein